MNTDTRERVRNHIQSAMNDLIVRRTQTEPFDEALVAETKPFGYLLVPIEVWKGSKFERSFVTTLGQGIFEQIGKIIAEGTGAQAENQYERTIEINTFRSQTIDSIIQSQRGRRARGTPITIPNLSAELDQLASLRNDAYQSFTVRSDLYIRRTNGHEEFYSFKTVKPNIDQTAEAKKNLLLLKTADPNCDAYFGLPYNPAGDGNDYSLAEHSIPRKLFDMNDTRYVLIGSDLWNTIGDDPNTYGELMDIFAEIGQSTREIIRERYMEL